MGFLLWKLMLYSSVHIHFISMANGDSLWPFHVGKTAWEGGLNPLHCAVVQIWIVYQGIKFQAWNSQHVSVSRTCGRYVRDARTLQCLIWPSGSPWGSNWTLGRCFSWLTEEQAACLRKGQTAPLRPFLLTKNVAGWKPEWPPPPWQCSRVQWSTVKVR